MKTKGTPFEALRIYFTFRKRESIIYCVVAAQGKIRTNFSTGHKLPPDLFDHKKGEVIQTNDLTKAIHADLERIKSELIRLYSQLRLANKPVNVFLLVDHYTGKVREQNRVLALQTEYLAHRKAKNELHANTLYNYSCIAKNMDRYLTNEVQNPDFPLHRVDLAFCQNFYQYLLNRLGPKRANKCVEYYVQIFKFALMRDLVDTNYFEGVEKQTVKQKAPEYLTIEQVHEIGNYAFSNADMQIVADMFLLCCYTGLYYSDLMELDEAQHKVERYGLAFIDKNRFKNDQPCFIPILPEALLLLEKYEWKLKNPKWQRRSDKANLLLKTVFELCKLPKHYSFRTGRKTFLTTMLNEYEFTVEAVAFMAGHVDPKMTLKHYARPNEKRVIQETQAMIERRLKPANVRSFEAIKEKKA